MLRIDSDTFSTTSTLLLLVSGFMGSPLLETVLVTLLHSDLGVTSLFTLSSLSLTVESCNSVFIIAWNDMLCSSFTGRDDLLSVTGGGGIALSGELEGV